MNLQVCWQQRAFDLLEHKSRRVIWLSNRIRWQSLNNFVCRFHGSCYSASDKTNQLWKLSMQRISHAYRNYSNMVSPLAKLATTPASSPRPVRTRKIGESLPLTHCGEKHAQEDAWPAIIFQVGFQ